MDKIIIYLKFFYPAVIILIIGVFSWFFLPNDISDFQSTLFGTVIGVGITIATAEGYRKLIGYERIKRTFGLLKLNTISYLRANGESLQKMTERFSDICSIEQAIVFLVNCAHLDRLAKTFDKSWLQLIYSQGFLDSDIKDNQFNKVANAISELLYFIDQLSVQSANAQINLLNNPTNLSEAEQNDFIGRARKMRDELNISISKLLKYTDKLDEEIMSFLNKSGVKYLEFDR